MDPESQTLLQELLLRIGHTHLWFVLRLRYHSTFFPPPGEKVKERMQFLENILHALGMLCGEGGTMTKGLGGFQEVPGRGNQIEMFNSTVKYVGEVNNANRIAEITSRAFDYAMNERGPTLVNIPRDYFYHTAEYHVFEFFFVDFFHIPKLFMDKLPDTPAQSSGEKCWWTRELSRGCETTQ